MGISFDNIDGVIWLGDFLSVAEINAAKQLVIDANNLPDAYVRPLAWLGDNRHSAQTNTVHLAIPRLELAELFRSSCQAQGHPHGSCRLSPAHSQNA